MAEKKGDEKGVPMRDRKREQEVIAVLRDLAANRGGHPVYGEGKFVLVCTVTRYHIGEVVYFIPGEMMLAKSSWIPDTGRWSQALAEGPNALAEIEVSPGDGYCCIMEGITEIHPWNHPLPTQTK